jgi:TatA/E family protein of Tat protein translocase
MNGSCPMAFLSGSPGMGELLVIFLAVLILFGPKRLPELARMIGRAMNELRRGSQEFKRQIMTMDELVEPVEPVKSVKEVPPAVEGGTTGDVDSQSASPEVRDGSSNRDG